MNKLPIANRMPFLIPRRFPAVRLSQNGSHALLYHTFSERHRPYYCNVTTYEKFYRDILLLKKQFMFSNALERMELNERELDGASEQKQGSRGTIYLTFDDSYRSILPVLAFCHANDIPTSIFVNTYLFENQTLLPKDKLFQALRHAPRPAALTFLNETVAMKNNSLLFRDYLAMRWNRRAMATLSYSDYEKEINTFFSACPFAPRDPDPDLAMMTPDDLRHIAQDLPSVRILSHGRSHFDLSRADTASLEQDIAGSKKTLEHMLGRAVSMFAYPYGFYSEATLEAVKRAGYTHAIAAGIDDQAQGPRALTLPRTSIDTRALSVL